ncbi:MAG: hypothetical protein M1380_10540 [Chloroflexi bacterium]|nr:hypothetical protein [Chloroflexota bacterium]
MPDWLPPAFALEPWRRPDPKSERFVDALGGLSEGHDRSMEIAKGKKPAGR